MERRSPPIAEQVSIFRLYLMRLLYLLNFVMLGLSVWPEIINHSGAWDPVKGVAFSFWAALSALSVLGLRYPLKMVPLLLLQMLYKSIWVITAVQDRQKSSDPCCKRGLWVPGTGNLRSGST